MALSANGYKQVNVVNRDTNQRVPITSGAMVSRYFFVILPIKMSNKFVFNDSFFII